jgi:hypothetical protein
MTIRIKCPHCHKALGVKDHLAGKKVACPVCKKGLKIPAPVSPAADVEDLAAAAFADAPKPVEPLKQSKPIAFTCPFCDGEVSVAYELGGKQTPCPECKRIIKVPKPVEDKPKDWRTVDRQMPSFAKQAEPQAPDGAWAPATAKRVSQQALAEAGAVPEVRAEPIGVRGWIRRGVYGFGALILLWLVWTFLPSFKGESRGLTGALAYIEPTSKLSPDATAAIQRAVGQYYAHKDKPEIKKAVERFGNARAFLVPLPTEGAKGIDRDASLWDLAISWLDIAGAGKEPDGSPTFDWKQAQNEVTRTLSAIASPEARAQALRDVINRLPAKGAEGEQMAPFLALLVEGAPPMDGKAAEKAKPQPIQQVALLLKNGSTDEANQLIPRPKEEEISDAAPRLAYAQGLARQGKYEEARALAEKPGPPLHCLDALLAVSAIALADSGVADRARPILDKAFEMVATEARQKRKIPVWDLIELGRLAARAGMTDRVQQLLALLPDEAAKGRVQLEQCRAQLDQVQAFVDPAATSLPEKDSLSRGLALEAFARHNMRFGKGAAVAESVDNAEENLRPFVLIGMALGEQDATRR